MFKSAKRKKSHGFTLAEVLIVVAIIGILLAVAIPNVISYYRSLKLTELDDSARSIFVAAQNRLTAMKSAGANLYALSTVEVNEKPDPGVGAGRFLAVTSAQADSLASLVPGGSIESQLHDNHYVVEIDAKTGAVYAVWYWEKENFDYQSESYGAVKPAKSDRLDAGRMVGYYGGSFVDRPNIGQTPMPSAQVVNAEELKLKISVPGFATGTYAVIKANVTISAGGKTVPIVPDVLGSQGVDLVLDPYNNVFEGEIALDTLDESKYNNITSATEWSVGKSFKNWAKDLTTGAYAIAPGANIDIEVKVTAVDTSGSSDPVNYLPQYLYWEDVNSLFASVEEDSVTGEPVTAHIAYGRHLQNLDSDTSGVTNTITAAEQTRSIDFNDNTSVTGVYSWAETYGSMFKPIENASLTSYNGHEYEIRNLNIQKNTSGYLGLFGFLSNYNLDDTIKFEKIILVNTKSEEGIVGALVGGLGMNGYIDDCHVYLDEIGTDGRLLDPSPRLKGSSVGGLVGVAYADLTMTNCSAATVISSAGNAGGLVSNVAGVCKISKSYAACNLTGAYVGGLVGLGTGGVTIQNSYAAGTADVIDDAGKARKVAGLVNWADGTIGALPPDLTSSYAAVRYGKSVTDALASGSLTNNVFGACEIKAGVTVSALYYVKQAGITYEGNSGDALSVSELKGKIGNSPFNSPDWYVPDGGATVNPRGLTTPYKVLDSWLADPYPYPMLASDITAVGSTDTLPMPHYGDWLENSYATSFYWEQENGAYKFYLVLSDGATKYVADGLCPDHHLTANMGQDIDAWGYGLIGIDAAAVNTAGLNASIDTANQSTVFDQLKTFLGIGVTSPHSIPWKDSNAPGADTLKGITDLLSDANNVILLKGASENKFSAIETGAGWLELNLGFAAAIDVTENTGTKPSAAANMGKTGAPYQIRTVRQLDNIPNSDSKFYEQTHDLYGKDYDADTSNSTSDVYSGPTGFSGNYNGGSYRILELDIDSGLFTSLSGADLHDIILYSPTGEAKNTSTSGNVGGLAGSAQNVCTIENCIVAGYKLSVSSSGSHVGGLIGDITNTASGLKITNCAAVNTLSGATSAGGLVGRVGSTVNISDSYAGGTVNTNNQYAGGIVGNYNGNVTVNYNNVYSYAKITSGFFVYGIGPQGNGSYNNCRYWTGGNRTGKAASDAATSGVTGVSLAQLESGVTAKAQHTYKPGANLAAGLEDLNNRTPPTTNDPYPYPAVVTVPVSAYDPNNTAGAAVPVHYGEWPVIEASATYVEIYQDNNTSATTYGLYGYLSDTNTQINTLKTDLTGVSLIDDCYGLLVPAGDPCPDVIPVNDGTLEPKKDASGDPIVYQNVPTDNTGVTSGYDLYRYDFVPAPGVTSTGYYHSVTLNKQEFWVNLDYGCEVVKAPAGVTVTTAEPQSKPGAAGFGSTDPADYFNEKVVLRTARQLAKMAEATKSVGDENNAAQLRKYEQLLDIDYSAYTSLNNSFTTGKNADNAQTPAALWRVSGGDTGSYDGHNHTISNLFIKGNSDNVGLFGEIGTSSSGNIQNIILVDVTVDGGSHNKVGALAGNVTNSTPIKNCGVYVSSADRYATCSVSGGESVGGLVGMLGSSTTVENSFAAVKVEGEDMVGGFVGEINGTKGIKDCYSGGHTVSGKYQYDSVNVKATGTNGAAGGFAGRVRNYNLSSNSATNFNGLSGVLYSTCSVSGANGSTGLFAGVIDDGKNKVTGTTTDIESALSAITAYGIGAAFDNSGNKVDPREETYLSKPTVTTKSGFTTHAYDNTLTGDYPYQTNLNEHYGDWVMSKFQVSGFLYWEKEDSAYHYSVTAWDRKNSTATWDELPIGSTLCNEYDTKGISNYGYGWFYAGDFDGSSPTMTDASGGTEDTSAKGALESSLKTALETALPGVDLGTVTVTAYSYNSTMPVGQAQTWNINIDGTSPAAVTLNPDFADTITTGGTVATPYKVRTIYQLQHINHTAYLDKTFEQGHDLDGTGVTDYVPIGNGATNGFTGSYDGQSYRILELSITPPNTVKNAALFASVYGGTVENVILYSPSGEAEIIASTANGAANAAGIVGDLYGNDAIVSNCAVAGYTITVNNPSTDDSYSQCIGGIAGWVSSNARITNCEAVVELVNKRASGGRALMNGNTTGAFMGGITGAVSDGGSVNITNCYAGGTIRNEASMSGGSNPYISAGGIVGLHQGSNMLTVSNCYSYMVWSGDVGTQTGQTGRYPIVNIINPYYSSQTSDYNAKLSNTYYIQGGGLWNDADSFTTQSNLVNCMAGVANIDTADADHTFIPSNVTSLTGPYPYPAVVTDEEGKYVHYGDWPTP